jgi:uncharacterized protein YbjT (DUF2867 family)
MRVSIFGGTGKTGRLILGELLSAGHEVRALAREPAKLAIRTDALRLVQGDARQPEAVADTIKGAQLVISTLAGGKGVLTAFGMNVVPAMKSQEISRIVSLIGASVRIQGDHSTLGLAMLHGFTSLVARDPLEDGRAYARILESSHLDYTLVRPPRLTDGPLTGQVRHAACLPLGLGSSISRADVAAFMIKVASEELYIRASPMIASN